VSPVVLSTLLHVSISEFNRTRELIHLTAMENRVLRTCLTATINHSKQALSRCEALLRAADSRSGALADALAAAEDAGRRGKEGAQGALLRIIDDVVPAVSQLLRGVQNAAKMPNKQLGFVDSLARDVRGPWRALRRAIEGGYGVGDTAEAHDSGDGGVIGDEHDDIHDDGENDEVLEHRIVYSDDEDSIVAAESSHDPVLTASEDQHNDTSAHVGHNRDDADAVELTDALQPEELATDTVEPAESVAETSVDAAAAPASIDTGIPEDATTTADDEANTSVSRPDQHHPFPSHDEAAAPLPRRLPSSASRNRRFMPSSTAADSDSVVESLDMDMGLDIDGVKQPESSISSEIPQFQILQPMTTAKSHNTPSKPSTPQRTPSRGISGRSSVTANHNNSLPEAVSSRDANDSNTPISTAPVSSASELSRVPRVRSVGFSISQTVVREYDKGEHENDDGDAADVGSDGDGDGEYNGSDDYGYDDGRRCDDQDGHEELNPAYEHPVEHLEDMDAEDDMLDANFNDNSINHTVNSWSTPEVARHSARSRTRTPRAVTPQPYGVDYGYGGPAGVLPRDHVRGSGTPTRPHTGSSSTGPGSGMISRVSSARSGASLLTAPVWEEMERLQALLDVSREAPHGEYDGDQ
jgi:hypothetical protein